MPDPLHILIATGGSGGHLYPAFAVAEEIERRWPGAAIRLTTGGRSIEREICASAGRSAAVLPLLPSAEAKSTPVSFARSLWSATRTARDLIREFQPACVVGTGGYSMTPVIHAAIRSRVPVVLLEQNAVPGRATRWFSRRAEAVCTSFETLHPPLKGSRIQQTGNPVRRSIASLASRSSKACGSLLILGGSQGARGLNEALGWIARDQPSVLAGHTIVHQTGGTESARELAEHYRAASLRANVSPFFDDMAGIYAEASVIIARAGATTMAEVACAGLPAILLPYPFARDRHQHVNAEAFARAGAAIVIEQAANAADTGRKIANALEELLRDERRIAGMATAMKQRARPEAAGSVVDVIASIIGR